MAAKNTSYKNKFTKAEVEECLTWFKQHMDELPASLIVDASLNIPDLRFTVEQMMIHLKERAKDSTVYSGQFSLLLLIRERLTVNG